MKTKLLLLSMSLYAISSIAIAPDTNAQFLCQAQENAFQIAVFNFNANPTPASASAVIAAQNAYERCINFPYPTAPASVPSNQL